MNEIEILKAVIEDLKVNNRALIDDLSMAKTALAETMKLFNNQPNDSGLRDHFAGLAMQGFISLNKFNTDMSVKLSYDMADAMLEERMLAERKK
jgi:hypothetical protein